MTYELKPTIARVIPFNSEGGALAAVEVSFGPITINTKLYKTNSGFFLSLPSRKSESTDKWYDQVTISDRNLQLQAQTLAVAEYERLSRGELVAV